MAGGKETPRQKMIGMMYLVLTALLALQVSAAIIQKFQALNQSLETAVDGSVARNTASVSRIQDAVAERKNKPEEVAVLDQAKQVRQRTAELVQYMEDLKEKLIVASGGTEEDGTFKGAKDEESVAFTMMGNDSKKGEAYDLQTKLNQYSADMSKLTPTNFGKIALDGSEDPLSQNDPNQKRKDFAALNFESTPMVAALGTISEMQSRVVTIEADVMNTLASKVGASDFKFDKLTAQAMAESRVVAAGTKYRAEMFISATSSSITPKMQFDGKPIEVDPVTGIGSIEFTATGGGYDKDGNLKKTWKGSITMPSPEGGGDTTFTIEQEYIVAKPVISIQSASVSALYMNCGNELDVQVPALGATYNPSFRATGATVRTGQKKGLITVIPTSRKVVLTVSNDGSKIDDKEFPVRKVPLPTIQAIAGGKPINEKSGVAAASFPRRITMVAEPDESFKEFLPKDARYQVTKWRASLGRGPRPVAQREFNSPVGDLTSFAAQARPGDRIVIEVLEVKRKNFLDNIEDVKMGDIIKNLPLN